MGFSSVMMSSVTPSLKYCCSESPLIFLNGSTATEGLACGRASVSGRSASRQSTATRTRWWMIRRPPDFVQCRQGVSVRVAESVRGVGAELLYDKAILDSP